MKPDSVTDRQRQDGMDSRTDPVVSDRPKTRTRRKSGGDYGDDYAGDPFTDNNTQTGKSKNS